jgi:hypothetical protein
VMVIVFSAVSFEGSYVESIALGAMAGIAHSDHHEDRGVVGPTVPVICANATETLQRVTNAANRLRPNAIV